MEKIKIGEIIFFLNRSKWGGEEWGRYKKIKGGKVEEKRRKGGKKVVKKKRMEKLESGMKGREKVKG